MKFHVLVLSLFLGAQAALAVVALPPRDGTNDTAEIHRANAIQAALHNHYFINGRVARLEREVGRLETAVLILIVLIGSTLAAVTVLTIRDRLRQTAATTSADSK